MVYIKLKWYGIYQAKNDILYIKLKWYGIYQAKKNDIYHSRYGSWNYLFKTGLMWLRPKWDTMFTS